MIIASIVMLLLVLSLICARIEPRLRVSTAQCTQRVTTLALCAGTRLFMEAKLAVVRVQQTGRVPELPALPPDGYHLFLSQSPRESRTRTLPIRPRVARPERSIDSLPLAGSTWSSAQDQVALIKRRVVALLPAAQIFLDVPTAD